MAGRPVHRQGGLTDDVPFILNPLTCPYCGLLPWSRCRIWPCPDRRVVIAKLDAEGDPR